jgi:phosphoglycerol transferase
VKKISKIIIGTILLVLANILFITITWLKVQFGDVKFAEIIFQLMIPLKGSNISVFQKFGIFCIIVAILMAVPGIILAIKEDIRLVSALHIRKKYILGPIKLWRRFYPLVTTCILMAAVIYGLVSLEVPDYIKSNLQSSTIFEEYYVDPKEANITFPEEKRNLIYIFMESMEDSYMSRELGGAKPYNLIPELTELQLSNTNFSASGKISGGIAATGSTWTVGAIVAQTAGIPLSIPIDGNSMNKYNSFLPGAYSIGDILNSQGYQQVFLVGSDAVYGGRLNYMSQHGNYAVEDYNYAIEKGWIDPDYHVFWGYEDQKLYNNAKEELTRLSESNQPFNLTMLTVDTHYVGGYRCEQCGYEYGDQYSNVIACGSKQLVNFISWIKQQPFYENTTIVISGDHPTMDSKYMKYKPTGYQRKVYSTIINSTVEYSLDFDRNFTTMDMFPTTLASLGVDIEGNRLGLGTNLFSETPTLLEEMGLTELNNQLKRNSLYYNEKLLYKY